MKKQREQQGSITYQESQATIEQMKKVALVMGLKRIEGGEEVANLSALLNRIVDHVLGSSEERERFVKAETERLRKALELPE